MWTPMTFPSESPEMSSADLVSILSADEKEQEDEHRTSEAVAADLIRLTSEGVTNEQAVEEQPPIMDLVELGRAFRALANARSRIDEIVQTARAETERIQLWRQQATEKDQRTVTYFEGLIGAYALSRREDSKGHDKSLTTPYGRVETREQEPEYIKEDKPLLAWATQRGYVRHQTMVSLDWARLKKDAERQAGGVLVLNGEVVPGVTVRDREPTVTVTPWE